MQCDNCDENINIINNLIVEAVIHGGDSGGPYCCNGTKLEKIIEQFLIHNKLTSKYEVSFLHVKESGCINSFPQIVLKF